jgi:hypothetical protein
VIRRFVGAAALAFVLAFVLTLGALFFYDLGDGGLTDPGEPGYPCDASRPDDAPAGDLGATGQPARRIDRGQ